MNQPSWAASTVPAPFVSSTRSGQASGMRISLVLAPEASNSATNLMGHLRRSGLPATGASTIRALEIFMPGMPVVCSATGFSGVSPQPVNPTVAPTRATAATIPFMS